MKKKLLLHILICVLLFAAVTVPHELLSKGEGIPFAEVMPSSATNSEIFSEGDTFFIGDKVEISYFPKIIHPGDDVKIQLLGSPDTLYDINVYYPSGLSAAKAFSDKYSLNDGNVSWEFTVSSRTSADKLRVVIRSESSYVSFYIPVTNL